MKISILYTTNKRFAQQFSLLFEQSRVASSKKSDAEQVSRLISEVKQKGNKAVFSHIKKFDNWIPKSSADIKVSVVQMKKAYNAIDPKLKQSIKHAIKRISDFAKKQSIKPFTLHTENNSKLSQYILPIARVGLYVPGGTASYFSTLLMNAIPAKIAGVKDIVVCSPANKGINSEHLLATAHMLNIKDFYKMGGATAIAALTYGTQTIKPVDKIFGPGNRYQAEAKRQVFGKVGIDMIAGPTEIAIICDHRANPKLIASDLLAQAEHDPSSRAIAFCSSLPMIAKIKEELKKQTQTLERKSIVMQSFATGSCLIKTKSNTESIALVNQMAPEHLHLHLKSDQIKTILPSITNAGAIFIGEASSEAFGDYIAGPNHVLPTNQTARFSSPLGTYSFQKRINIINLSQKTASRLSTHAARMAQAEGLTAHQASANFRKN